MLKFLYCYQVLKWIYCNFLLGINFFNLKMDKKKTTFTRINKTILNIKLIQHQSVTYLCKKYNFTMRYRKNKFKKSVHWLQPFRREPSTRLPLARRRPASWLLVMNSWCLFCWGVFCLIMISPKMFIEIKYIISRKILIICAK